VRPIVLAFVLDFIYQRLRIIFITVRTSKEELLRVMLLQWSWEELAQFYVIIVSACKVRLDLSHSAIVSLEENMLFFPF